MKVLFLDIDGVLNVFGKEDIIPSTIPHLNRILEATNCKVVISSDWRCAVHSGQVTLKGFEWMLATHGVKNLDIIGVTRPQAAGYDLRGHQIKDWLTDHSDVTEYVVLDDMDERVMEGLSLAKTDSLVGLTSEIADEVIRRLGGV